MQEKEKLPSGWLTAHPECISIESRKMEIAIGAIALDLHGEKPANMLMTYSTMLSKIKQGERFTTRNQLTWYNQDGAGLRGSPKSFKKNIHLNFEFVVDYKSKNSALCDVYAEGYYCGKVHLVWHRKGERFNWIKDVEITIKNRKLNFLSN